MVQLTRPATPLSVPFLMTSSSGSRLPPRAARTQRGGVTVAPGGALGEVVDGQVDELLRLLRGVARVEHHGGRRAGDAHEVGDRHEDGAVVGTGLGQRRHGAVHVGGEHVDGAGGHRGLLVQPVAREADEHVVNLEALHELLAGLDGAHDAQALGAGAHGLVLIGLLVGEIDQHRAQHGLVAVDDDVDVGRVEDAQIDLDGVRLGRAEQGILCQLERHLRTVGGSEAEPQCLEGEAHVVAVDVGHRAGGATHVLVEHAAWHDAQLLPRLHARLGSEGLDQRRRALMVAVELRPDGVGHALGQGVARLDLFADRPGEELELAPVLDLIGAAGSSLSEGLHDLSRMVGVRGGAHGVLQQEVAHGHAVGVDAADSAWRLGGEAARALRTQGAADALFAERAAPALGVHAVEDAVLAVLAHVLEHGVDRTVIAVCHDPLL